MSADPEHACPIQVNWMRNGIVYSRDRRIRVGTSAYGRFLCTAVNAVGPALSASLAVEIKGEALRQRLNMEVDLQSLFGLHVT
jgi:hypothetical protein